MQDKLTDRQLQRMHAAARAGLKDLLDATDNADALDYVYTDVLGAADVNADNATDALQDAATDSAGAIVQLYTDTLQACLSRRTSTRTLLGLIACLARLYVQTGKDLRVCLYSSNAGAVPCTGVGVSNADSTGKPSLALVFADADL